MVVTGSVQGTADFDPGTGTFNLTSAGSNDIFVWKLDSQGGFAWARVIGGTANDIGHSVAIAPDGDVVVTGEFRGTVDFDPGPGIRSLVNTSTTYPDVFVTRLDAAGDLVWANPAGGNRYDFGRDVAVGPDGSVYVTGNFQNTADFIEGASNYYLFSAGSYDAFLWKVTAAGDFVWAKRWGSTDVEGGLRARHLPGWFGVYVRRVRPNG